MSLQFIVAMFLAGVAGGFVPNDRYYRGTICVVIALMAGFMLGTL